MFAAFGHVDLATAAFGVGDFGFAGIGGAHFDPAFEVGDDVVGEFLFGRHFHVRVFPGHGGVEGAGGGVAGGDGGMAGLAAEEGVLFVVEEQAAADFGGVGGVAFVAVLDEDRADVFFEEGELVGGDGGVRRLAFGLGESGGGEEREAEVGEGLHGIPRGDGK